jgi:protoheme IX farnesyltransferase
LYTTLLLPAGWLPYFLGYISLRAALVCTVVGLGFLYTNYKLCLKQDKEAARGVMFGSFLYLPAVQLAVLFDKLF